MYKYKQVSEDTQNVMKKAVNSDTDYYALARESIGDMLDCDEVYILCSANACLVTIAESIPDPVLVGDMGGWNGFIKSCELFEKKVEYIETDNGLINTQKLDEYLAEHDTKSLYITSLAGYSAIQPLNEIKKVCSIHEVILIVDISGSIGSEEIIGLGDIQISSTGSPKIVNIENGGFICNNTKKVQLNKHLLKSLKADKITCAGIEHEMGNAPEILRKSMENNTFLKEKLIKNGVKPFHADKKGLNIIIPAPSKSKAKKIAYNIRQEIKMKGNIINTGPNYNRIKKASIIIETKNLDPYEITREDLDNLAKIITTEYKKK